MIDWKKTQENLAAAGYAPGTIDGLPGRGTMAALMGYVAGRQPDAMIRMLAAAAATELPKAGIMDSEARLSEFLGETSNETGGFSKFEENMHYSAARLTKVWPSRFPTVASALPFAWDSSDPDREDVALANRVYGGRMGNERNGTNDNDGWDNRGGGLMQHTGEEEYRLLRERIGVTSEQVHTDPMSMVRAACDRWLRSNMNKFCDRGDFRGARKAINGGYIGVDEVAARRIRAQRVIV